MPETQGNHARPKVIYIMGAGRSGSTILGVALGNCSGCFFAGELDAWLTRSGIPNFPGEQRAVFWEDVRREVPNAEGLFGPGSKRYLEASSSVLKPKGWLYRLRFSQRYRQVSLALYDAVGRRSGATHVVDTSHYPLRALEMIAAGVELYVVFVVREPGAVVASFRRRDVKQRRKGAVAANAYLAITYLLSTLVFLRQPKERRLFLRYEQFAAQPGAVLQSLVEFSGVEGEVPDLHGLATGLGFQGNRVLGSDEVTIERTEESRRPSGHRISGLVQSPWARLFRQLKPSLDDFSRGQSPPG